MSLIGKEVQAFRAQAYQQGKFVEVSEQDLKGRWSVCFSTQQTLHLFAQQN